MVNIIIGFVDAADLVSAGLANLSPRTWHRVIYTDWDRTKISSQTPPASLLFPRQWRYIFILLRKNLNISLSVLSSQFSVPQSNNHWLSIFLLEKDFYFNIEHVVTTDHSQCVLPRDLEHEQSRGLWGILFPLPTPSFIFQEEMLWTKQPVVDQILRAEPGNAMMGYLSCKGARPSWASERWEMTVDGLISRVVVMLVNI